MSEVTACGILKVFLTKCLRNILGPEILVGSHRMSENSGSTVPSKHENKRLFGEIRPKNMYYRCFLCAAFLFLFLAESVKIPVWSCAGFPSAGNFFQQQQTLHMHNKRSPKIIWIGAYIVEQTWIYVQDVFSWK